VPSLRRWWVGELGVEEPAVEQALATFNVEKFRREA
jgi:hypothetical protein